MKKEKGSDRISTFIGADASIDGNIEFKGTIRVDGACKGKYPATAVRWLSVKKPLSTPMLVNVAVVMGEVNGSITMPRNVLKSIPRGESAVIYIRR